MAQHTNKVAVIGAGIAGLSAAIQLVRQGYAVSVFEASTVPGGRARHFTSAAPFQGPLDNGMHLLSSAYHETQDLLKMLGSWPQNIQRYPLCMHYFDHPQYQLKLPIQLPAPLQSIWALFCARGFSFSDRLRLFRAMLQAIRPMQMANKSVQDWLEDTRQSEFLCQYFWNPLCISALNTAPQYADAVTFLNAVRSMFLRPHFPSSLIASTVPLSDLLAIPALKWLQKHQTPFYFSMPVQQLCNQSNHWQLAVRTPSQQPTKWFSFNQIVIATAPQQTQRLLPQHPDLKALRHQLQQYHYGVIVTVWLQLPQNVSLPQPMGMLDHPSVDWVFDHGPLTQRPGLICTVTSDAQPTFYRQPKQAISAHVIEALQAVFPHLPSPLSTQVVIEKHATIHCRTDTIRPKNRTALKHLWLVGDYTNTTYPATIEGAVCSARILVKEMTGTSH